MTTFNKAELLIKINENHKRHEESFCFFLLFAADAKPVSYSPPTYSEAFS